MTDASPKDGRGPGSQDHPGYARSVWHRLRHDRFAMLGLYVVLFLFLVSYLAPVLANNKPLFMRYRGHTYFPALVELFPLNLIVRYPELRTIDYQTLRTDHSISRVDAPIPYSPGDIELADKLRAPSRRHWMGTDDLGRDVASRMIHGAGISLRVGFVAAGIALIVGIGAGALAGFYGGAVDLIISRLIEVMMCFPTFFLILAVIAFLPPSIYNIMVIIGLTRWTAIARYTRGEFFRMKAQDFAFAARALGASDGKIIFRHILPNSLAPALVSAAFGVANAILIEAGLSFLGFGVQPPTPSWGGILSLAREYIESAWWLATIPGIAIFLTVSAYNILGEGLRDAIDPRQAL